MSFLEHLCSIIALHKLILLLVELRSIVDCRVRSRGRYLPPGRPHLPFVGNLSTFLAVGSHGSASAI
ncbi:hypothetical protein PYCCODRAFT_611817 [Trametes coccinea BRFM310]|uniref:Cytochrome P450 n=1 Tax=Trametes coccinea (strain BRFM310) TaxID=1353009 RepID=A0A1Y2J5G2_TRAC3|nr:hypothetical protein PYCCODRAFT_611817 [Trametes coccinea BRFM310]